MRRFWSVLAFAATGFWLLGAPAASALPICPNIGAANTDCGFIFTVNADGSIGQAAVTGANPYDGSDDVLVGVINNSSSPLASLTFGGVGNGGGLFAFDGDGLCNYTTCNYPNQYGYEGPLNTFTNISANGQNGTVLFSGAGLAGGTTTYFSLEGSPASINIITPPSGGTGVPEPATLAMLAAGLLGLGATRLRSRV